MRERFFAKLKSVLKGKRGFCRAVKFLQLIQIISPPTEIIIRLSREIIIKVIIGGTCPASHNDPHIKAGQITKERGPVPRELSSKGNRLRISDTTVVEINFATREYSPVRVSCRHRLRLCLTVIKITLSNLKGKLFPEGDYVRGPVSRDPKKLCCCPEKKAFVHH